MTEFTEKIIGVLILFQTRQENKEKTVTKNLLKF